MSNHAWPQIGSGLYEYAFVPVPKSAKKSNVGLFFVLTGYTSALSCLLLGANLGIAMPFWSAVGACALGDLFLIFIGSFLGGISAQSGWSTTFFARQVMGKTPSFIFSCLIIFCSVFWVGLNGEVFSKMLISVFPFWQLPVPVTGVMIIIGWAYSSANGWYSLQKASYIVVPCSLMLLTYITIQIFSKMGGAEFLMAPCKGEPLSFAVASSAAVGNYIFGCSITPDTCRYAKSPKDVFHFCPFAYAIGLFSFNVCGIIAAKAGGFGDFVRSVAALELTVPTLLCTLFCLWITQNINIYGGSLAIQNIFMGTALEGNVSHKAATFFIAGMAAAFSVLNISSHMLGMVSGISIFMVPFPGILLAQIISHGKKKANFDTKALTVAVWVAGVIIGVLFIKLNLPIPPFLEMLFSAICYIVVVKIRKRF